MPTTNRVRVGNSFWLSKKSVEALRSLNTLYKQKREDHSYHAPEIIEMEKCEKSGQAIQHCRVCSEHEVA